MSFSVRAAAGIVRKRLRQGYVRVLRSPGAPREIAGGLAIGLFVAFVPAIQMPIAVAIAAAVGALFRMRLSRVAAAAGVWLTNPVTGAPLYGLAFFVGRPFAKLLSGDAPEALPAIDLAHLDALGPLAWNALLALLIGGVIVGIPVALVGYHLCHAMVVRYQRRRALRVQSAAAEPIREKPVKFQPVPDFVTPRRSLPRGARSAASAPSSA